jgi:hypothetical protein
VVGDAMFFNQFYEILWRVTGKCRFAEMRICGNIVLRAGITVGEVATPAARYFYFFANAVSAFED